MAVPQAPPYPGFAPYVAGGGPYPQQQFPHPAGPYPPGQAYPSPGQPYPSPGQQYPAGQPYPSPGQQYPAGQPYPSPGQQYPAGQPYPSPGQQYPQGTYPPGTNNTAPYGPPPIIHMQGPMNYSGGEEGKIDNTFVGWSGFTDKAIRAIFIRKVYAILMVQLLFSLAIIALFVFEPHTKMFVRRHTYLYYVSYFLFLGVYIALLCCGNLRRQYPTNMILLSIFVAFITKSKKLPIEVVWRKATLENFDKFFTDNDFQSPKPLFAQMTICMSYMLGTISSFYDTDIVLMAVGICAGVCLAVSVLSFHTKFDFTSCGGVLFILVWVLFLFGIIAIFTRNHIMNTVYAACGALLFTAFLAYDTQMLMGGKKHELSPEEHIFAAMQIYLDIVYIFMFLLMLFGSGKK